MKKHLILLAALTSLSANANDFSSVSFGVQYGIDDGLSDSVIGHAESNPGGYGRLSWNFYDHIFADYNISYSSFDGPSIQSQHSSTPTYASTTKQDFGLGYYFELGSYSPYVKVNKTSFKQSYKGTTESFTPGVNGSTPPDISNESYTADGYGLELGSFIHISDNWSLKVLGSISKLEESHQDIDLYETYFISDTKFGSNWAFEAALGYRKLKAQDIARGEFMPQVGLKYDF
ncbi:MAG: outer membrane beta-barrel protein [Vibrio splendidus]